MSQPPIAVAIHTPYPLDQAALAALVASLPGLQVVLLLADPPPRVLVWDPGLGGLSLPPHFPGTAVLLLIGETETPHLPAGVAGLFSKSEGPEALGVAIRQVARGDQYLSPSLAAALIRQRRIENTPVELDLTALTEREREILALLAQGLSNKAIAARLYLSVRTVEGHLANLYVRLDVHSRTEAALMAIQHGLSSKIR